MKNKYLFQADLRKWNSLIQKFRNLYLRIKQGTSSGQHLERMINKLKSIYMRLEKLQYRVGVRLAGTTLAFMFISALSYSQHFNPAGKLLGYPAVLDIGDESSPVFADIDGDGDLDLYVGCSNGIIRVLKNDGSDNFSVEGNLQADGSDIDVGDHSSPVFADIDSDDDLDLITGNEEGTLMVFTNDGSGNFSEAGELEAGSTDIDVGEWSNPVFADIDEDGDLDLYVGEYEGFINVFLNDGSNIFSAAGKLQVDGSDLIVGEAAVPFFADVDDDGDLDLYVGIAYGIIGVLNNDGSGNFSPAGNLQADGSDIDNIGSFLNPVFEDLDNDDDLDLYIGAGPGNINIYTNDGTNTFSRQGMLQANGTEINAGYSALPEFADVDDDGDLDLYLGGYYGNINVFTNDGSGVFSFSGILQADGVDIVCEYQSAPAFADIDGDGDLDLYVGEKYGTIKVFENNGSSVFSESGNLQTDGEDINVGYGTAPTFADVDDDGDLDLYAGASETVKVYINDGSGNFSDAGNVEADGSDIAINYGAAPEFADIDEDGDLDLYIGEAYGYINVFLNDGDGNFSSAGNLQSVHRDICVDYCSTPAFADIDEDGDHDLYVGDLGGFVNVYTNDDFIGVKNPLAESGISIYPNPSNGIFTVETDDNYLITVYDVSGNIIRKYNKNNQGETIVYMLDMSDQSPGMYCIMFQNEKIRITKKIIVK